MLKCIIVFLFFINLFAEQISIPLSYKTFNISNLEEDKKSLSLKTLRANPKVYKNGIMLSFDENSELKFGKVFYGILKSDENFSTPKYRNQSLIKKDGRSFLDLRGYLHKNDSGKLFYRVINKKGRIIYEGKLFVLRDNNNFKIDDGSIIEGPFVNNITKDSATISFEVLKPKVAFVKLDNSRLQLSKNEKTRHEIVLNNLLPNTKYKYKIKTIGGSDEESYSFKTALKKGDKEAFSFGYAGDSRNDISNSERDIFGVNSYVIRRISALAYMKNIAFLQFGGDEIKGYSSSYDKLELEYTNWKNATLPFSSYIPIYTAIGNHESLFNIVNDIKIDKFPFETKSMEALFGKTFVNPQNGPITEDGTIYDPSKKTKDFPSYKENAYYYTYGNIAMIVLNSQYWYSPSIRRNPNHLGGNIQGFIMDNQLKWLKKTLKKFQEDNDINHIFINQHAPIFPNGGHIDDSMFYNGKNELRPFIANKDGKLVAHKKGIIERRDEYLRLLLDTKKVVAVLTGHEHSYSRLEIKSDMPIYKNYEPENKLKINRKIYQINNGAGGSPYYEKGITPWNKDNKYLKFFTTQTSLVLFHIDGMNIDMEVINPETLQQIEYINLIKE